MFDLADEILYSPKQEAVLSEIKSDVRAHFSDHPDRLEHIEGVALSARCLAMIYYADPFICECAGYLHDWDKYLPYDEMISEVDTYEIDMGVDPDLVIPLLHGKISARKLKDKYPDLPEEVFHAIDTHTTGETFPSDESAVLYIADFIEPSRPSYGSFKKIRSLVGTVDLVTLYIETYKSSLMYLINTNKYVWPRSIDIYNKLTHNNRKFN